MEVTLLVVRVCPFVPSKTKCRPQDRNKNKAEENLENIDGLFIAYINAESLKHIGPSNHASFHLANNVIGGNGAKGKAFENGRIINLYFLKQDKLFLTF